MLAYYDDDVLQEYGSRWDNQSLAPQSHLHSSGVQRLYQGLRHLNDWLKKTRVEWVMQGEKGGLNRHYWFGQFQSELGRGILCLEEGQGEAPGHPGVRLMKCCLIFQGPGIISCIIFTFPSFNFKLFLFGHARSLQFMNHTIHLFPILYTSMVENELLSW